MMPCDIYWCLMAETIGKTKKIKKTKDSSQNHSKTIENNQKNQKTKDVTDQGPCLPLSLLSRRLLILVSSSWFATRILIFRDNKGVGSSDTLLASAVVAEIFVFLVFLVIFNGFARVLARVLWFQRFFWFFQVFVPQARRMTQSATCSCMSHPSGLELSSFFSVLSLYVPRNQFILSNNLVWLPQVLLCLPLRSAQLHRIL